MPENIEKTDKKSKKGRKKRELIRISTAYTDGELCNKCRVWAQFLEEHLAAFQALDSMYDMAFIAAWRGEIDALEGISTNEQCEDMQLIKRDALEEKRQAFFDLLSDLEYYIVKSFPKGENKAEEFGLHKLRTKSAKRGIRDVVIGYATLIVVDFYNAELLAGGMPPTFPAQLDAALGDYAEAEVLHQHSLLDSIRITNNRMKAFNTLYARHRLVATAAEAVFGSDEIKINLFR